MTLGVIDELLALRIKPYWQCSLGHERLGITYGEFAEVEDRRGQHSAGVAVANALDQVLQIADAAGSDHRHGHRVRDRARERDIETLPRAVAVHGSEQDLAGTKRHHLARISDGI